jgi:DNA-binding CsgD family transcriptional regulator
MTDKQFEIISRKLDVLVRLAALSEVSGKKQEEQVKLLSGAGFQPKEMADLLGTTSNAVSVALSKIRKRRRK